MSPLSLAIFVIAVALVFDFINGFHDAANSVATVVATRVLTPFQAVAWAAFFNFVSAFTFGTGVAGTVGNGFVDLGMVTPQVILAGLIGGIVWDLITWWFGLPTSSSHALIGGYAGSAMANAGWNLGIARAHGLRPEGCENIKDLTGSAGLIARLNAKRRASLPHDPVRSQSVWDTS
jgi:inorganic phosphate transporter, PiT family